MKKKIILGTVQFGLNYGINNLIGQPTKQTAFSILNAALQMGVDTLDTADAYGSAHSVINSFHHSNPDQKFIINTKFAGLQSAEIKSTIKKFCTLLSVNQIQTLFFHSYNDFLHQKELLPEIQHLKEQGLINQIGLSVYDNSQLKTAVEESAIDVIQLPFNILDNAKQKGDLLIKAKNAYKILQVRSVFLQGLFFKDINTLPKQLWPLKKNLVEINRISTLSDVSTEALCLAYVANQREIDEVIIGVDSIEQLSANIKAFDTSLDQEIINSIDEIEVENKNLLYPYNWK